MRPEERNTTPEKEEGKQHHSKGPIFISARGTRCQAHTRTPLPIVKLEDDHLQSIVRQVMQWSIEADHRASPGAGRRNSIVRVSHSTEHGDSVWNRKK